MILKLMGYKVSKEEGRKFVEIAVAQARYVRDDARLGLVLCDIREEKWTERGKRDADCFEEISSGLSASNGNGTYPDWPG